METTSKSTNEASLRFSSETYRNIRQVLSGLFEYEIDILIECLRRDMRSESRQEHKGAEHGYTARVECQLLEALLPKHAAGREFDRLKITRPLTHIHELAEVLVRESNNPTSRAA